MMPRTEVGWTVFGPKAIRLDRLTVTVAAA